MENKIENKLKSRDIFYAIIALATLIVAIIGATLAYFSITASSEEGAVNARAATVSISYDDGKQVSAAADKLIPASLDVVEKAYANARGSFTENGIEEGDPNLCTDDKNQQVCSIYRFSIQSDSEKMVTAKLLNEHNEFNYLAYAVYDVTNSQWLKLEGTSESRNINKCDNTNTLTGSEELDTSDDCFTMDSGIKRYSNPGAGEINSSVNSIFGLSSDGIDTTFTEKAVSASTQTYDIVLFIKENNDNQNVDQGATYNGTIQVEVVDSGSDGRITGYMND